MSFIVAFLAIYLLFGASYFCYRRGYYGDAGLIGIVLVLLVVFATVGFRYVYPAGTAIDGSHVVSASANTSVLHSD